MNQLQTKILCIWDGFGFAPASANNVPALVEMKNFKSLLSKYPWTTLDADGTAVGQEGGLVGNSEVGHMNIGGLKLVPQLSYQITQSAQNAFKSDPKDSPDQNFDPHEFIAQSFQNQSYKTIHLIGLFSTGTIHSDLRHWAGAIQSAGQAGADQILLHIISDGRDSDPKSLLPTWGYFVDNYGKQFEEYKEKVRLGSVGGRFYAMDRDKNWERNRIYLNAIFYDFTNDVNSQINILMDEKYQIGYQPSEDLIVTKSGTYEQSIFNLLEKQLETAVYQYEMDTLDEYLQPTAFINVKHFQEQNLFEESENGIKKGQTVWLLNFRTDRFKQLAQLLCEINSGLSLDLKILGMNDYGVPDLNAKTWKSGDQIESEGYYCVFKNKPVDHTLADYIAKMDQTQLHIAETEKFNHVTYFLNGGQNKRHEGEDWVVIDSNKVSSHAEKPEMKALEITDYILDHGLGKYDYIVVNYANPDMVGHTGDIQACKKSMQVLDEQLGRLIDTVEAGGHRLILTADHGNIEKVGQYEDEGQNLTDTEHNADPVPCILVGQDLDIESIRSKISAINPEFDTNSDFIELFDKTQITVNSSEWLTKDQIPEPKVPLWIAGAVLVSM